MRTAIVSAAMLGVHESGFCAAGDGSGPRYSFVFPNIMVNRYSLWMGTMRVTPCLIRRFILLLLAT